MRHAMVLVGYGVGVGWPACTDAWLGPHLLSNAIGVGAGWVACIDAWLGHTFLFLPLSFCFLFSDPLGLPWKAIQLLIKRNYQDIIVGIIQLLIKRNRLTTNRISIIIGIIQLLIKINW